MASISNLLGQWLADSGQSMSALAARCGVHPVTVLRWKTGQRQPRPAQLAALNGATGGFFASHGHGSTPPSPGFAEAQAPFADQARALGLDPDTIAAKAIAEAIRAEKARRWIEENREAIEAHNAWIEKHGVPLAKYRMF